METLYWIVLALHIICWIGALVLVDPRGAEIKKGASHAVAGALVLGIILVGIGEAAELRDYNHMKIGIKLVLALAATVIAFMGQKKSSPNALARPLFGLVAINILIAILW